MQERLSARREARRLAAEEDKAMRAMEGLEEEEPTYSRPGSQEALPVSYVL